MLECSCVEKNSVALEREWRSKLMLSAMRARLKVRYGTKISSESRETIIVVLFVLPRIT